jgi:hypothetical protein
MTPKPTLATGSLLLPRLIRIRDAPQYLGMDRNRFNADVRPHLTEIPIGDQGIAFDRLDLDAWADDHKSRNGRPGSLQGDSPCIISPDFALMANNGSSTNASRGTDAFSRELALAKRRLSKRNNGSTR